jgi:hypothetical protein
MNPTQHVIIGSAIAGSLAAFAVGAWLWLQRLVRAV